MKSIYKAMPAGMKVCSCVCAVYILGCLFGIGLLFLSVGKVGNLLFLASLVNPMGIIGAVVFIDDVVREGGKLFPGKQKLYIMIGVVYVLLVTLCWFFVFRIFCMF